jgi:hypothetical protein
MLDKLDRRLAVGMLHRADLLGGLLVIIGVAFMTLLPLLRVLGHRQHSDYDFSIFVEILMIAPGMFIYGTMHLLAAWGLRRGDGSGWLLGLLLGGTHIFSLLLLPMIGSVLLAAVLPPPVEDYLSYGGLLLAPAGGLLILTLCQEEYRQLYLHSRLPDRIKELMQQ